MATLDTLQDAVDVLTTSTTSLLTEVNVNKSTLTNSATSASNSATNAAASAITATTQASNASASASAASSSASDAASSALAASAISLANEPVRHSVRPSLLLDFANTKTLDPRITFTRASTATYYDGKTVAKAEENLVSYSQEFDNAYWAKTNSTVTANSTTAPDSTTTAETLAETSATSFHVIAKVLATQASGTHTVSVYLKDNTRQYAALTYSSGANITQWIATVVDLVNGTITQNSNGAGGTFLSSSIASVGNGWYRVTLTGSITATDGTFAVELSNSATPTFGSYASISYAGDITKSIYIWGAQLEQRSSVTDYTATTTAPITNYVPVLLSAPNNVARFEHNPVTGESIGLEIEEQRTNLVTYSDDFANATWTKLAGSVTSNTIIAPDGTQTADKLVEDSTTAGHYIQSANATVASGATVTATVYAKAGERTFIALYEGRANKGTYFNISTGVVGGTLVSAPTSSSITSVGNGWYRCSITVTVPSTLSTMQVYLASADGTFNYAGNGWNGVYIWGAQLEAGSFATSYIPTVASQVTRSADSASMTGTNFSSWYRTDEGTLYAENSFLHTASPATDINSVADLGSSAGTTFSTRIARFTTTISGAVVNNNTVTASLSLQSAGSSNVFYKSSIAYKANDFAGSGGGGTVATDSLGEVSSGSNVLWIGGSFTAARNLNGTIKKLAYYPKRLTNAELQGLTTV